MSLFIEQLNLMREKNDKHKTLDSQIRYLAKCVQIVYKFWCFSKNMEVSVIRNKYETTIFKHADYYHNWRIKY